MSHTAPDVLPSPAKQSWWLEDALRQEDVVGDAPPLSGPLEADVAIIGGGYTGLWTALALRQRDPRRRVALIEATICGGAASGKNGAKVHGYWTALPGVAATLGDDGALAIARAGDRAQDALRQFAARCDRDLWWREGGSIKVAASPAQDAKIAAYLSTARRLGVPDSVAELSAPEMQARIRSPVFRRALYFTEGATLHPGRLVRALRDEVIRQGVQVFENTPMTGLDAAAPNRVRTPQGEILARHVVLATNTALGAHPALKRHLSVFSSYALMTEASPNRVTDIWPGDEGASDLRMFVHYFRKTPDGRVLMGSGSGPIGFAGHDGSAAMRFDRGASGRAVAGLRRLLPELASVPVASVWGGPIDIAADRLPFFGTLPGTTIHYGCGYSGHGVNPTHIGGQCLASLVLGLKDEWTSLPFCTRTVPSLPPEPFRYIGGNAIRWGIMSSEAAEERGEQPGMAARAMAAVPRVFGLRIGVR
ncbi:NAD(P)/FAD-dependent oxidoreductase [Muricoccus radiodurans]|uniref:NAD(P)/FAD-dependent oxidoreductase n=1 Tax=Muricoccus radiodurans TaxID=2231721 RepID=UPI003CF3D728